MGMYNTLFHRCHCPHCGDMVLVDIQFKYGSLHLIEYQLGDAIIWDGARERGSKQEGELDVSGLGSCPSCSRYIDCVIHISMNKLCSVSFDPEKFEMIERSST